MTTWIVANHEPNTFGSNMSRRAPLRGLTVTTGLLVLMAWTGGCASTLGRAGAINVADPSYAGDRRITASARLDLPHRPHETTARDGRHAALETTHARPALRMTDGRQALALSGRAPGAGDRAARPPALRPTSGRAVVAAGMPAWTRKRWTTLLTHVVSNERLAQAAMWIASGPLRVRVSPGGFFVALRVPTPY